MLRTDLQWLVLCMLAVAGGASGGDAAGNPADTLAQLAKASSAPEAAQLKEPYLQLQWLRLMGEAACPKRVHSNAEKQIRGKPSAPLSDEEKARLKTWFEAKPKFRERFLLAVNATDDHLPDAARVALKLHEKFPKECETLEALALAFAVVWDDEGMLRRLNAMCVPELRQKAPATCTADAAFGWYVTNLPKLCPWFKNTPWRLLTYVAADNSEISEREWVFKLYPAFRNNLGTVYSEIKYDLSKIRDGHGKIGGHEYDLANVKEYGGVCRDQAYYARAVCRAYGLPSYMATAVGNAGTGHAWVGWVVNETPQGYKLLSHGRYESSKFFTAGIVDPQSGRLILDYLVGIEAKGLSDESSYDDAELYYRVSEESADALPAQARLDLCIAAVRKNPYHRAAWLAIGEATAAGELPRASAEAQWEFLKAKFKEFPDFTFSMLSKFSRMFKTAMEKYNFYEVGSKWFLGLKRQDLVARLRIEEIDMCVAENRKDIGVQAALAGMQECAGEGAEGAALAKRGVELLREMKQPQLAIKPLQTALAKMPRTSMNKISPHWKMMMELLRDLYQEAGDTKKADATTAEIEKAEKSAEKAI